MHELWTTVVGPLFGALAPEVVAIVAPEGDRLGDMVRHAAKQSGARVVECGEGETPPTADLVAFGAVDASGWSVRGAPVVLCHPLTEHPPRSGESGRVVRLPGFGGCNLAVPARRDAGALQALVDDLRVSPLVEAHLDALEAVRVADGAFGEEVQDARVGALLERLDRQSKDLAGLREQIARVDAGRQVAPARTPAPVGAAVATEAARLERQAMERFAAVYQPDLLLDALGWAGEPSDLACPLPIDVRGVLRRRNDGEPGISVVVGDEIETWRSLRSVLAADAGPLAVTLVAADPGTPAVRRLRAAEPLFGIAAEPPPGDLVLRAGVTPPPPPGRGDDDRTLHAVGYVLPGVPPGGSGGSHSIVQEVRGLKRLGLDVVVHVPAASMPVVGEVYPESAAIFRPYGTEGDLVEALAGHEILVATEAPSVAPVVAAARRHGRRAAYYIQDYEPLFNAEGSARADGAVLSYRADPDLRLFAKTDWLANLLAARHGLHVAKVAPSLDERTFHRDGRVPVGDGPQVRIAAMVRPRTPRRRPAATVAALAALVTSPDVRVVTFGCDARELAESGPGTAAFEHHGILARREVADLLRGVDVFVDLSIYQAFGRTGLEAMACGAVPVLPAVGGVMEYATHGHDALLLDGGDRAAVVAELRALTADRARMATMSAAGAASAGRFSLEAAARSLRAVLGGFVA